MNSMWPLAEIMAAYNIHYSISHFATINCYNNYAMTMMKNNNDTGCPEDRTIRVYNYSFLTLLRKSPNETPVQFNQCRRLILDFVLKVANIFHLVTKQAYEMIDLVVQCAYDECISMNSLGFNIFGKGSVQCYKNICHLKLNH